ncbi:hypothetical protein [Streptomyces sp. NPDC101166]
MSDMGAGFRVEWGSPADMADTAVRRGLPDRETVPHLMAVVAG